MKTALYYIMIIVISSEVGLSKVIAQTRVDGINTKNFVLPDNIDSANCVFFPEGDEWGVRVGWSSSAIVSNYNIPLVGDLDDDGHPEIVCFSKNGQTQPIPYKDNQVLVFDGVSKQLKTTLDLPSYVTAYDAAAYGLIKTPSRKGLIIVACYDFKLRAYDITSANPNTPYWVSNVDYGTTNGDWSVNVNFADFNHDGHPEVYVRNKIYNAETGVLLATAIGSYNTASSWDHFTHITHWKMSTPNAADIVNDENLELVLGNEIYKVTITNPNGTSGNSITLERSITPPNGVPADGNPQVADFNADGHLDVFISIRNTDNHYGSVYGYVWDVYNNVVSEPFIINTSFSGKSIPMIGDIDNDGLLEVLIQCGVAGSNQKFQAYKYHPNTRTFDFMWGIITDEDSYSNGITAFDFNQDGLLELIICDQSKLRIVNGSGISHITHNDTIPVYVMSSFPFSEITIMQYPVIVDADNDGNAEIVSVGSDKLNILESNGALWAPTRKVWNQYMYNITHVNNDLTVTQHQFNNATAFVDPDNVVRRPYNHFLQQVTTLDQYGRPFIAAVDVAIGNTEYLYEDDGVTVTFDYCNQGDKTLFAPYHITAFANHFGGNVLASVLVNEELLVGDCTQGSIHFPAGALCGTPNLDSIAIIVNCTSNGIAQNGGLQPECDITNNTVVMFSALFNDTTYITTSACNQFEWLGETLTQSGAYHHTFTNNMGCDSLVILDLTISPTEMTHETAVACAEYEWKGNTYYQSGTYEHYEGQTINGCDSIAVLDLTLHPAPPIEILGYTQVAFSSDLWHGIYHYYVVDSTNYEPNSITWSCSNSDWILFPITGFHCLLIAKSQGIAVLTANAVTDMGCNTSTSIEINASNYGVGDEKETSVMLFPNPAQTQVTVQAQGLSHIKLFNLFGQAVKVLSIEQADVITFNIDDLSQGVYMVEITTLQGRIIKQLVISR